MSQCGGAPRFSSVFVATSVYTFWMAGQFLTAGFEMRHTWRKAAVLERVRAKAEWVFWDHLVSGHADLKFGDADGNRRHVDTALIDKIPQSFIRNFCKGASELANFSRMRKPWTF